jgi:hypothetical protein
MVGAMAKEGTLVHVYKTCINTLGDAEYCASLVEVVLELSTRRVFSYTRGRDKPRFYLVLPRNVDYTAGILVDSAKKSAVIMLRAPHHMVHLTYERNAGERFVFKNALVFNMEVAAAMNGPIKLSDKLEGGGP